MSNDNQSGIDPEDLLGGPVTFEVVSMEDQASLEVEEPPVLKRFTLMRSHNESDEHFTGRVKEVVNRDPPPGYVPSPDNYDKLFLVRSVDTEPVPSQEEVSMPDLDDDPAPAGPSPYDGTGM